MKFDQRITRGVEADDFTAIMIAIITVIASLTFIFKELFFLYVGIKEVNAAWLILLYLPLAVYWWWLGGKVNNDEK
jgi:hypothetical protein